MKDPEAKNEYLLKAGIHMKSPMKCPGTRMKNPLKVAGNRYEIHNEIY